MNYHLIPDIYYDGSSPDIQKIKYEIKNNIPSEFIDKYILENKNKNESYSNINIIKSSNRKTLYDTISDYIICSPIFYLHDDYGYKNIFEKDEYYKFIDLYMIHVNHTKYRITFNCHNVQFYPGDSDMTLFRFDIYNEKLCTFNIFIELVKPYDKNKKMKKHIKIFIRHFIFHYKIRILSNRLVELILYCISNTITNDNIFVDVNLDNINTIYSKYEIAIEKVSSFLMFFSFYNFDIIQLKKQIDGIYHQAYIIQH